MYFKLIFSTLILFIWTNDVQACSCAQLVEFYKATTFSVKECAELEGYLYWRIDNEMTFDEAEQACRSASGHLASIHSLQENRLVRELRDNSGKYTTWIGLHRKSFTCSAPFVWTDGSSWDYSTWNYGQPDCYKGVEHCVEFRVIAWIGGGGCPIVCPSIQAVYNGWNDEPCDKKKTAVCKADIFSTCQNQKPWEILSYR